MASFVVHAFLPHETNNHRAKLLHLNALSLYLVAFVFYQLVTWLGTLAYPSVLGYATDIRVNELLSLTNAKRQEAGQAPLSLNDRLSQAAAGKAADMFAKGYWAHTSPEGKLPWDFIVGAGYRYTVAGENLAKNFNDSGGVVNAWMDSPTHKENLLKPSYKEIGFAIVNGTLGGEETTLVVQMFGASSAPLAALPQQAAVQSVSAQGPAHSAAPTVMPTATNTPAPLISPVVVVNERAVTVENIAGNSGSPISFVTFGDSLKQPILNLGAINHGVTFTFLAVFIGLLAIDAVLIHRKRIMRVSGHTHAHILFFSVLLLLVAITLPGSII